MNIVLLGMPGSGKGTQADLLAKSLNLHYVEGGKIARQWANEDKRIAEIVKSGGLIPEDEMTLYVTRYLLEKVPDGENILFEGYPRYVSQYKFLESWLGERKKSVDKVIFLKIDEEVVVKRLSSRRICGSCGEVFNLITNPPSKNGFCDKCGGKLIQRKDDNPKSIRKRFDFYRNNTEKVVEYVRDSGKLVEIEADQPIQKVFEDILSKIN